MEGDLYAAELHNGHVVMVPGIRRPQVITLVARVTVADELVSVDAETGRISGRLATISERRHVYVEHRNSVRGWPEWRFRLERLAVWSGVVAEQDASGMFFMSPDEPVTVVVM
jgi:hypothetical protein